MDAEEIRRAFDATELPAHEPCYRNRHRRIPCWDGCECTCAEGDCPCRELNPIEPHEMVPRARVILVQVGVRD